jgi:hypothetical protein
MFQNTCSKHIFKYLVDSLSLAIRLQVIGRTVDQMSLERHVHQCKILGFTGILNYFTKDKSMSRVHRTVDAELRSMVHCGPQPRAVAETHRSASSPAFPCVGPHRGGTRSKRRGRGSLPRLA